MNRIRITTVRDNSVAVSLGLQPDDILETLADVELTTPELLSEVLSKRGGQPSLLTYYRNGEKLNVQVASITLGVTAFHYTQLIRH